MEQAKIEGFDYADHRVAKALGCSEQKVKRARLQLTRAGWFYRSTYTNKRGRKVVMIYLGQVTVAKYKANDQITSGTAVSNTLSTTTSTPNTP
jgi:hypothetical protein